ncbi:hypothetical protein WKI65_33120 [Streptomyces sp. MS1.AVA.3]|uniref:hypothetical protein n=1 Tax=Streptomyces TaxID=1883 RepID=UPI0021D8B12F|nr:MULTISPECIES: hypothetical protein [unclassified Streptomyces]UYB37761.1 hypothetical protein SLV14_000019 [Streptomyces sp. Je 1-4]UYB44585.1 hypothetical protein SLV14_007689 [Streptomyces sp. Je 1-4]UZQ33670.1 hypothetical protein SLV14N_000019 [Streptomyces sp. Je 1-4] [Streptomyces sp. Je 1-4 4N24]UZQ41053.1 hypothetical protein SLV14N_007689 [Streptomyces sp. Je 1-4] [Streptomyces sp. Je 1-4 4N24]UZQ41088.1 hypothetical protein SLV14NA_000019 [Streptomyces sp. Je 1-4] [Streptomyces sp
MINPSGVVHALTMCLAPEIAALATWLESVLTEQADTGEGLLRLPGAEQGGAEVFMHGWIDHLHQLTDRARARRTGADEDVDGARPSTRASADISPAGSSMDGTDRQPDEGGRGAGRAGGTESVARHDGELGVAARLDAHGFLAAARAVVEHRLGLHLGDEEHRAPPAGSSESLPDGADSPDLYLMGRALAEPLPTATSSPSA